MNSEEAPSIGKPVLVMRNLTEREEQVGYLVGTDESEIFNQTTELIESQLYKSMSEAHNPMVMAACDRIVSVKEK